MSPLITLHLFMGSLATGPRDGALSGSGGKAAAAVKGFASIPRPPPPTPLQPGPEKVGH